MKIELLEDNKAKIINNNLIESETLKSHPILGITIIFLGILFWVANLVTENIIFSYIETYIGPFIFIVMTGLLIWMFVNAYNTDKKGVNVKGKVISRKVRKGRKSCGDHWHEYEELVFNVAYDHKVYEIQGLDTNINVGDEVEITLYKNWAVLTKSKGTNYKALPLLELFISAIVYIIAFYEKIETNLMYIIPFLILLILMFIYIPFAADNKKRKKEKVKE